MIAWLKFIHIATISIWAAGLIALPWLYVQRGTVGEGHHLFRLQALVRFSYVAIISPAAFVAVASGTGLIFAAATFQPWFGLKLILVGVMVVIHVMTGLVIIGLFEEGENYPRWRWAVVSATTVGVVAAIVTVVLAKPVFDMDFLPDFFSRPGALGEWGRSIIGVATQ